MQQQSLVTILTYASHKITDFFPSWFLHSLAIIRSMLERTWQYSHSDPSWMHALQASATGHTMFYSGTMNWFITSYSHVCKNQYYIYRFLHSYYSSGVFPSLCLCTWMIVLIMFQTSSLPHMHWLLSPHKHAGCHVLSSPAPTPVHNLNTFVVATDYTYGNIVIVARPECMHCMKKQLAIYIRMLECIKRFIQMTFQNITVSKVDRWYQLHFMNFQFTWIIIIT